MPLATAARLVSFLGSSVSRVSGSARLAVFALRRVRFDLLGEELLSSRVSSAAALFLLPLVEAGSEPRPGIARSVEDRINGKKRELMEVINEV